MHRLPAFPIISNHHQAVEFIERHRVLIAAALIRIAAAGVTVKLHRLASFHHRAAPAGPVYAEGLASSTLQLLSGGASYPGIAPKRHRLAGAAHPTARSGQPETG